MATSISENVYLNNIIDAESTLTGKAVVVAWFRSRTPTPSQHFQLSSTD
jgi:hypothetical protein